MGELKHEIKTKKLYSQTWQGKIEIWSHNTGLFNMKCTEKGIQNEGHAIQVIA